MRKRTRDNDEDAAVAAPAPTTATTTTTTTPLKVTTFNVLADHLCKPGWFRHRRKAELDFAAARFPAIKRAIEAEDADVVCLQELQVVVGPPHTFGTMNHAALFDAALREAGYVGAIGARASATGSQLAQGGAPQTANGVFFKQARFDQLLVEACVPLLRAVAHECRGDKRLKQTFAGSDVRGTVATLAALGCRATGRVVVVATTHLPAPRGDDDVTSKLEQLIHARALLRVVSEFCGRVKQGVDLVVVAGDFNSLPGHPVLRLMESGRLGPNTVRFVSVEGGHRQIPFVTDTDEMVAEPLPLVMRSSVGTSGEAGPPSHFMESAMRRALGGREPAFTNHTPDFTGCLDYIMTASAPGVVVGVEATDPSESVLDHARFLPDPEQGHGSDHLPVTCRFLLSSVAASAAAAAAAATTATTFVLHPLPTDPHDAAGSTTGENAPYESFDFRMRRVTDTDTWNAFVASGIPALRAAGAFVMVAQGEHLGRTGALTLLSIKPVPRLLNDPESASLTANARRQAASTSPAVVIDVLALGGRTGVVFAPDSPFRALVESPDVVKLMHDCRIASDALWHQFRVSLSGVLDLQPWHQAWTKAPARRSSGPGGETPPSRTGSDGHVPFAPSVAKVLGLHLHRMDLATLQYDAPHKSDPNVWGRRPLPDVAWRYAAGVAHMLDLTSRRLHALGVPPDLMARVANRSRDMERVFREMDRPVELPRDKLLMFAEVDILSPAAQATTTSTTTTVTTTTTTSSSASEQ